MSNHNYTQYSNKNHENKVTSANPVDTVFVTGMQVAEPVVNNVETTVPNVEVVKETVKTVSLPETVEGVVVGCAKLNVRAEANLFSNVVCVLNAQSEIQIDVNKSNNDWFYICTATGIEGYCMRKYVEAHL